MSDVTIPFVEYLEEIRDGDERQARAVLAILRRGLGQEPGASYEMLPFVVNWFPAAPAPRQEDMICLIASLFAWHPQAGGSGNLGDSFARARTPQGDDTAIERRFTALLAAHGEDLPYYLRQAVSFLRSKETPVNWHQLYRDVEAWERVGGAVQRRWARAFWGRSAPADLQAPVEANPLPPE